MTQSIDQISLAPSAPVFIIAEVAQTHDGSLGTAHAYIDAVAKTGANAIKFQTHIADAESSPGEPWRVKFSYQDKTRFDYWKRMEFTAEQWAGLKQHADEKGLVFLSSPFSLPAVELLHRVGMKIWKIASGEINNPLLLNAILKFREPVLLSTGMSPIEEISETVEKIRAAKAEFALLQCSSRYPCPPEKVGLNLIQEFRDLFGCPTGLSDHSGTIFPCLAAATLGAKVLELHVTMSREAFGPDVIASVTTSELRTLVDGVRFIEKMLANPLDKNSSAEELKELRGLFMRSVFAAKDLPAGTVLQPEHLAAKKPGTGIPAKCIEDLIGCELKVGVKGGELLALEHLAKIPSALQKKVKQG